MLEGDYNPENDDDSQEIFKLKEYFMYSVFNKVLQSDMGKTIVRKYAPTSDAQSVWRDFESLMSNSSKGLNERHRLHAYVFATVLTEVCQLLEVSWQMCHAWIAHWTVARATLTMSRRRTHARSERARTPFGAHVSPFGASSARIRIMMRATSVRIKEPSMASDLHIKSSVPNTYQ